MNLLPSRLPLTISGHTYIWEECVFLFPCSKTSQVQVYHHESFIPWDDRANRRKPLSGQSTLCRANGIIISTGHRIIEFEQSKDHSKTHVGLLECCKGSLESCRDHCRKSFAAVPGAIFMGEIKSQLRSTGAVLELNTWLCLRCQRKQHQKREDHYPWFFIPLLGCDIADKRKLKVTGREFCEEMLIFKLFCVCGVCM